jgi:anti-sigma factor RsiW
MSCSKFETDIALYAGGDLPPARIARVEGHLIECTDCRALAEDLRAEQALLSELRDSPLEDAMVAQVRQRVLAEVRHTAWRAGFSPRGALAPLLALAAALVLAAVLAWHHPPKPVLAPRGAAPRPGCPLGPASHAAPTVAPLARKSRHHFRRTPAAQPGPPLLVQFVTDDPNIVVYWLIDQKPQGD